MGVPVCKRKIPGRTVVFHQFHYGIQQRKLRFYPFPWLWWNIDFSVTFLIIVTMATVLDVSSFMAETAAYTFGVWEVKCNVTRQKNSYHWMTLNIFAKQQYLTLICIHIYDYTFLTGALMHMKIEHVKGHTNRIPPTNPKTALWSIYCKLYKWCAQT